MRIPGFRYGRPARILLLAGLLTTVATVPGCSGSRGVRRPFGVEAEGTTIGRDLRTLPRGSVAPATALGVDLVNAELRAAASEGAKS